MAVHREPRRANLATIVGSSLAVVAAGSLLAFSSLAEQAGLQGLATGGIQPAHPGGTSGGGQSITIPAAATDPPRDPRDALAELVRESAGGARVPAFPPVETTEPEAVGRPAPPQEIAEPERPRRIDNRARIAVDAPGDDYDTSGGPPYGHAYGHHEKKHRAPKPARKHAPKDRPAGRPVHARSADDDEVKPSKEPKGPPPQKVKKEKPASPGNGKAKGHSKHAHKGKGKGHSKHGG